MDPIVTKLIQQILEEAEYTARGQELVRTQIEPLLEAQRDLEWSEELTGEEMMFSLGLVP